MKPKLICNGISNNFGDYKEDVTIFIDLFEPSSTSKYKIFLQLEPNTISGIREQVIKRKNEFDLILSFDEETLKACENSKKYLFYESWIKPNENDYNKRFQLSFIMSSKILIPGHKLRFEVWDLLSSINNIEIIRHKSPPHIPTKFPMFKNAQYSIAMENSKVTNYFSEKLLDCLVTKTIPIYYGCPNIGEYFDASGVFTFTTVQELKSIISSLTQDLYEKKLSVIEKNYNVSMNYSNFWQRLDKEIISFIEKTPK